MPTAEDHAGQGRVLASAVLRGLLLAGTLFVAVPTILAALLFITVFGVDVWKLTLFIGLTLWETESDMVAGENDGYLQGNLEALTDLLQGAPVRQHLEVSLRA